VSGCAALVQSVTDRGIMSDRLNTPGKDPNRLKSMIGDRRLLRVVKLDGDELSSIDPTQRFLVCPEPFSGAVIARGAKDGISVTKFESTSDEVTQTAVPVDTPGEAVRMYEDQSAWLCFQRASGDLSRDGYIQRMDNLGVLVMDKINPPKEAVSGKDAGSSGKENGPADLKKAAADAKAQAEAADKAAAKAHVEADAAAKAAAAAH
jgi:hypothetical protein